MFYSIGNKRLWNVLFTYKKGTSKEFYPKTHISLDLAAAKKKLFFIAFNFQMHFFVTINTIKQISTAVELSIFYNFMITTVCYLLQEAAIRILTNFRLQNCKEYSSRTRLIIIQLPCLYKVNNFVISFIVSFIFVLPIIPKFVVTQENHMEQYPGK